MKQVLSAEQRRNIRADIYSSDDDQVTYTKDGKISFFQKYAKNKTVLDLGCIDHDPENRKSKFWMHKAIISVASKVVGLDYYEDGVEEDITDIWHLERDLTTDNAPWLIVGIQG